jgi:hypothetical protein
MVSISFYMENSFYSCHSHVQVLLVAKFLEAEFAESEV